MNGASLDPQHQEQLAALTERVARSAGQIEDLLDIVDRLSDTGVLAGAKAILDEFDDSFNAALRPDLMALVANGMTLLGTVAQLPYEPLFNLAMEVPPAAAEAYPRFAGRTEGVGTKEALEALRSPEIAALLDVLRTLARSQMAGAVPTGPAAPTAPKRTEDTPLRAHPARRAVAAAWKAIRGS